MELYSPMSEKYLEDHPVFKGLPDMQFEAIHAKGKLHILKKGQRLSIDPVRSNRVYFLVSGKIKISDRTGPDNHPIKDLLYPGEMFGNVSLNGQYSEQVAGALVNNTIVYCFSASDFRELLGTHHELSLRYGDHLGKKLASLKERYAIWTMHDTQTRFLYLLQKWSAREGIDKGDCFVVTNYLTMTDFAEILSVSRQFVYLLLKELEIKKLVKYDRKEIIIWKRSSETSDPL